ncbi:unnamed protein product [Phytophthora fragariaefolia]|uniref:Unnamed protein product n=1 Tax=Phytophthora fragariaefolia TaxID=1490495 RepID=A0A9W6WY67_9STRA|nr:unnamed protein product [Phytophthora fragariaefolia]
MAHVLCPHNGKTATQVGDSITKRDTTDSTAPSKDSRLVLVGWDLSTVFESLGIDPFNDQLVRDEVALTSCSLGCVLQQLYQSGPSGHVTLVADYIFHGNGFSLPPVEFSFPIRKSMTMGLLRGGEKSGRTLTGTKVGASAKYAVTDTYDTKEHNSGDEVAENLTFESKSLFDKNLRLFAETTYGRMILVDQDKPGWFGKNSTGILQYIAQDALALMNIMDIKHLLNGTKNLKVG